MVLSGPDELTTEMEASDVACSGVCPKERSGNIWLHEWATKHTHREVYRFKVHFDSDHAGFYEQLLIFKFETSQQSSDKFEIMRLLEVIHRTSCNEEHLPPSTDSSCILDKLANRGGEVLLEDVVSLKMYSIPNNMENLRKPETSLLWRPLNWNNYDKKFHLLLHVEELYWKTEIDKYNQDNAAMFRHKSSKDILILKIPGIAGISPLMLAGNQVKVTPLNQAEEDKLYHGWVLHVDVEQVYLRFKENFPRHFRKDTKFRVNFGINRTPLRMQHRAAELAYKYRLKEVLFPTGQFSSHHSHLHSRMPDLENNPEQCKAVQHIVASTAKPAPYLVFGPPGTGKTMTLVEAIKRIVKTQSACNVLVCAPSNSATDHLCEKILEGKIDSNKVYRFYALNFPVANIPQNLKSCCNLNRETNTLEIPPKEELMTYQIMAATLITVGRLVSGGIPPGHYTYIFLDEAGQATETESIIPIAGLLRPQTCQVVLAGDPKQLGPSITSRIAEKHGLGVSLLERLMRDISLYKYHETYGFNNRFVTKLLKNYRSHPAILKIPNELFYRGELQPCAHQKKSLYRKWELLPNKGFPMIFHGVAGTYEREPDSPSGYNMAEVEVLKEYLKSLIDTLHKKGVDTIETGEIGIIAPYRKQVEKIQTALQTDKDLIKENLKNITVGTVEKFQGKEFNVILVSAVRSNPKLTEHDQRFTLGFVSDEKRFNVAITRARALLIVVGDPRVLKINQTWNKFIDYCSKEGGYRGITVSDAEEDTLTTVYSPALCSSSSSRVI
ncbi:putative helicase mov-10-B.2 [Brachyistius frenatus]|uniref:putative helicase mov-10-B.2 n=1 Tax=Brachyistius frenatus TaxID=100188 RepID=UPI0037E7996A